MSELPAQHAEAARWLAYALEDLETAQALADENRPLRLACMLAQQAAEKALKAGFIVQSEEPPRTHNLARLRVALGSDWTVGKLDISLGELSEWAVASRYPGEWEEPTESDAEAALYAATGVVEAMTKDLRARGLG